MDKIKESKTIDKLVYAYEPLAYYFGMKPNEFWNCTYREVVLFCEINSMRKNDNFKANINLQEAVTNKLIQADGMNKRPKIVPLRKMFEELFG